MKTAAVAATAIMALLVVGVATTIYAHSAPGLTIGQSASTSSSTAHAGDDKGRGQAAGQDKDDRGQGNRLNLTVGQTITLSGLTGKYVSATNESIRGNAAANLTLQVTGVYKNGYTFSITSGTLSVAGVNYAVTGGTVELGPIGQSASGTGTTSASGQFLISLGIHGTSTTNVNARVVLDLKTGGSEYLVSLGTPHPVDQDDDTD